MTSPASFATSAAPHAAYPPASRWRVVLDFAALFAAALLVYWPTLSAGLVWNDRDYITAPALQSVGGLKRIWFELGSTEQYYPVLHSAFWLEHRVWGDAAAGYHAINILLHASSACLLVMLLRRLRVRGAWVAGLLFVVHPVMVESVAWIAEQKNTLSLLFGLLALLTYFRWLGVDDTPNGRPTGAPLALSPTLGHRGTYWLAFAFFGLALLSKSVTATLPPAILVILWWRNGSLAWRRDVRPLLPWFITAAAFGMFSAWVEKTYIGANGSEFGLTLLERTLLAGHIVGFYVTKLFWPENLMFIYPRWSIDAARASAYVWPLVVVALVVGLWWLRRRTRGPLAVALLFVGTLFPVLGFFNVYGFVFSYVADHWLYLSSVAVMVAIAAVTSAFIESTPPRWRVVSWSGIGVVIIALGCLASQQTRSYRTVERFYRTIIATNPTCWMAWNNLGTHYADTGQPAAALPLFERALKLKPTDAGVYDNLGNALRALGREREAVERYTEAVRLRPRFVAARLHLAATLDALGRAPDVVAQYVEALRIDETAAEVWNDYGAVLIECGRAADAVDCYQRAIRLRPEFAAAHQNLGAAYLGLGRLPQAIDEYRSAVALNPNFADAHTALGVALAQSQQLDSAIEQFRLAVRLTPGNAAVHANLAHALELAGQPAEAAIEQDRAKMLESRGHADQ